MGREGQAPCQARHMGALERHMGTALDLSDRGAGPRQLTKLLAGSTHTQPN
jgi:hypothetical protein